MAAFSLFSMPYTTQCPIMHATQVYDLQKHKTIVSFLLVRPFFYSLPFVQYTRYPYTDHKLKFNRMHIYWSIRTLKISIKLFETKEKKWNEKQNNNNNRKWSIRRTSLLYHNIIFFLLLLLLVSILFRVRFLYCWFGLVHILCV